MANGSNILLITGTDTGVGKTTVGCALVAELLARGVDLDVSKPVETGCRPSSSGELIPEDGIRLRQASGQKSSLAEVVPLRFELPAAPTVAAAAVGQKVDTGSIIANLKQRAKDCDLLVVEGAGGLLVPIAENFSFADLAKEIGARVLVVIGSKLGAINHSALTFEALAARHIPAVGYVLNECYPPSAVDQAATKTNRDELKKVLSFYRAAELAYFEHFSAKSPESDDSSGSGLFRMKTVITDLAAAVICPFGL